MNVALFRAYGMTSPCVNCGHPVREGVKFCDPYCTYAYKSKLEGGK